jgi:uncharacterized membrane protein YedE/YeeE
MKYIKFLLIGFLFGVALIKSEAMSWFRIQEMFRFQSIHMYGIFGSAVVVGGLTVFLIKKFNLKSLQNEEIILESKPLNKVGNVLGGISFGFGWALTGCCIAPLFVLTGYGSFAAFIMLLSAIGGVWFYGNIREKLPH